LCEDLFKLLLPHIKVLVGKNQGVGFGVWTSLAKVLPPLPRRPAHAYDIIYCILG